MNEYNDNKIDNIVPQTEENNLIIDQIPLRVKPTKAPKPLKQQYQSEQEIIKLKLFSNIKILIVILLLIINITLIINIVTKTESNENYIEKITGNSTKISSQTSILGEWKTERESLFQFNDDYIFYWFDSYSHQADNYYAGTYTYTSGDEALKEMGYTDEDFIKTFGENIDKNNIYSIYLKPNVSFKNGVNSSEKDLNEGETWWFILVVKSDKKAIAYNKTLDLRYNLTKN